VTHLRSIALPFVVVHSRAARVRTRLRVEAADEDVLRVVGRHLGSLAGEDLAQRCREHKLSAKQRAQSRRERKRAITAASSSRWAGAITRTSEDSWQLAWRNLVAERRTLASRIHRIERRLTVPVGERRGFKTRQESYEKRRRLQHLRTRLAGVERRLEDGESRSAGEDPVSRRPVTISMLPASAKPPGGSGGRPSASSSAPTARPVSSSAT